MWIATVFILFWNPSSAVPVPESIRQIGEKKVHELVVVLFLSLATELWTIVIYGLATLACKEECLRINLEPTHCFFEIIVFMHPNYMWLKPYVVVELGVGDATWSWMTGMRV